MLKLCKINACPNGTLGLHLSRAPWDPYPWVSGVQESSSAYQGGVRIGDTVLELNGIDILGQKISEMALSIHGHWDRGGNFITFLIWRSKNNESNSINQQSLQKFATCLQNITQLLECPVCLEVVKPPGWQCCNGHVLCHSCRGRTVKCPICRVTLGPRGRCLLSDKLFTLLAESFPCDGVKQGNSPERRCPEDYHNHYKTSSSKTRPRPLDEITISKNIKDPTLVSLPVPLPLPLTQQKYKYQDRDENQVKEDTSNNIKFEMNSCKQQQLKKKQQNQQKDEGQRLLVKDIARVVIDRHLEIAPSSEKDRCKNYHCPTGKLCFTTLSLSSRSSSSSSSSNFSYRSSLSPSSSFSSCSSSASSTSSSASLSSYADSVTNQNDYQTIHSSQSLNIKMTKQINIENSETNSTSWSHSKMPNTDWEILSHLTRRHHVAVAQFYGTYGENVQVEFMNNKSIPCISIAFSSSCTANPFSSLSSLQLSSEEEVEDEDEDVIEVVEDDGKEHKLYESTRNNYDKTFWTTQNASQNLLNIETELRTNGRLLQQHSKKISQKQRKNCRRGQQRYGHLIDLKSSIRPIKSIEQFFVARIPINDYENDDAQNDDFIIGSNRYTKLNPNQINASQNFCQIDAERTIASRPVVNFPSSRTFIDFPYNTNPIDGSSPTQSPERDASKTNEIRIEGNLIHKRCAIFVWYCGSEDDVKNFESVIECKRTGTKWTGCTHALTNSWESVRQSGNYILWNYDSNDTFDIVIKIK